MRLHKQLSASVAFAALLAVAGCATKAKSNANLPVNPPKPVVRTPESMRHELLPLVNNWFDNHGQRFTSAADLDGRLFIDIRGLKISPETDKLAKQFAFAMGEKLTETGFVNDFTLNDIKTRVAKTYQFKSIDVMARETVLKAVDVWFLSQKKIRTNSSLDPEDDTKLIVTSPDFTEDNHTTLTIEFSIKQGKSLHELGFNPAYTVTNGRQSWPHKLY